MGDFMQKMQAMRIDSKYSLVRKIGEGGHGLVYIGMPSCHFHSVPLFSDYHEGKIGKLVGKLL